VFDVGANIGLMALPVLYEHADVTVCSFEPSPSSTPFLERTVRESPYGARWRMFAKALGEKPGTAEFCMSDGVMGSFDGFCDTSRPEMSSVPRRTVEVPVSTLDSEWEELGRPDVSAIKIDVEGAEFGVLQGGASLIAACRPTLVMEWSRRNLPAYGVDLAELFRFAAAHSYLLFTADVGTPVRSEEELLFHMWSDEEFVLVPMARPEKA
jgi:FkbM family methyltransferase